jgi:hypothetical protein
MDEKHLAELLSQDVAVLYDFNRHLPSQVPVKHEIQPWVDLVNIICNGKFKINKPKISRMRQSGYVSHYIRKHYITLSATLSCKGKKINLHNPEDLDFKDFTSHDPPHRRVPNILSIIKCGYINDGIVRTKIFDYVYDICQPNLTNFVNIYKKVWQNTILHADEIIEAHFNKIGDVSREKLRKNLAKFLKNSDFIDMNKELIMILLGQSYQSLELFASFAHRYRQDAQMITTEDIETAQELAKVMQVQEV